MPNPEHLDRLKAGVPKWNPWRAQLFRSREQVDLRRADLSGRDLKGADFTACLLDDANLEGASLQGATFSMASLQRTCLADATFDETTWFRHADLTQARFSTGAELRNAQFAFARLRDVQMPAIDALGADFVATDMTGAHLQGADLRLACFIGADLSRADLTGADLTKATLVEAVLDGACLNGCKVYGTSAWEVRLDGTQQNGLIVTPDGLPAITVDDLELAQFVYLLLNNKSVRRVIDTITSKVVLILGSFSGERKAILDALRDALRRQDYTPILFDFEKPSSRDITETVSTLAHMARFVIADLTDARSVRQELERIVPDLPSGPVQPLLHAVGEEFAMFDHFRRYPWVLEPVRYESQEALIATLGSTLIPTVETALKSIRR